MVGEGRVCLGKDEVCTFDRGLYFYSLHILCRGDECLFFKPKGINKMKILHLFFYSPMKWNIPLQSTKACSDLFLQFC